MSDEYLKEIEPDPSVDERDDDGEVIVRACSWSPPCYRGGWNKIGDRWFCDEHATVVRGQIAALNFNQPKPILITKNSDNDLVRTAAENLRQARVDYAEHWVMAKSGLRGIKAPTDETATQMTIAATKDEITTLEAEYRIALSRLGDS